VLEVIDVSNQHRQRPAGAQAVGHQRLQMAFHVAPVVQSGQSVGNRHFDAFGQLVAQKIRVPLALDLGLHAGQQLVPVDGAHQVVVDAHIEAAQQAGFVAWFNQHDDGQMPRAVE